ncbi:MAG: lytic transglycosylase domain-containing protein [Nitrospirae bacterium]|nr:lytic transglycosylase domain-containing protein [Nitrospirota bacterium]
MISLMITLLVITILLFTGIETQADIYQYTSDDGVIFFTNTHPGANAKLVVREGKSSRRHAKKSNRVYVNREVFHNVAEEKAKQHNIDPRLVKAVIRAESNWNPDAVSPKGALGLMQLMPATASVMGVGNPFDPAENIDGGIRYLKYLLEKFNGNLTLALAAYNAGPRMVEKNGVVPSIPETVAYVKRVMAYYTGDTGTALKVSSQEIQKEIKREFSRIKRFVLEDGTLFFTNTYLARSYAEK